MCNQCRIEYLSDELKRVTVERDAARDRVAQLERDLDETCNTVRIARETNAALSRAINATVATRRKERDALQEVIDSLLRVPQSECSDMRRGGANGVGRGTSVRRWYSVATLALRTSTKGKHEAPGIPSGCD